MTIVGGVSRHQTTIDTNLTISRDLSLSDLCSKRAYATARPFCGNFEMSGVSVPIDIGRTFETFEEVEEAQ